MPRNILLTILAFVCFTLSALASEGSSRNGGKSEHISLGDHINSIYDEQQPVLSPDGKSIYFTRSRHPENIGGSRDLGDIWYATKNENGDWGEAKNAGVALNNADRNAVIGFSRNGNQMFLQNHYSKNGTSNTQGVSVARKQGNSWSYPEKLKIDYFRNKSDLHSMSLSADGSIMVMSLESYKTKGVEDIYVSFRKNNNSWTEPKNLGNQINTKFQEMTPFLGEDNITLYFSSNGYEGYGGRDVYVAKRLDNTWTNWSTPENIGEKINTEGVELSYRIPASGNYSYLVSTQNSDGYGDIYKIKINPEDRPNEELPQEELKTIKPITASVEELPGSDTQISKVETPIFENAQPVNTVVAGKKVLITGKVLNTNTLDPVRASLQYSINDKFIEFFSDDSLGGYRAELLSDTTYNLKVTAPGYLTTEEVISLKKKFNICPKDLPAYAIGSWDYRTAEKCTFFKRNI